MPDDLRENPPAAVEQRLPQGWARVWWPPIHYVLAVVVAAVFAIPLIWMVGTSLRPLGLPPAAHFEWLPPALSFSNYPYIFQILELGRFLRNSVLVVIVAVPLTVLTASLAGFALAQLPQRLRDGLIAVSVGALLVPTMALWITRFLVYKAIGLLDTPLVLVAPAFMGTSPFYVLLFTWAFARLPRALYEQAQLDGAGAVRIWWTIGLPLMRPAITAVIVLAGLHYWSDLIDPLLYINNQQYYTLPVGIQALQQMDPTNWPLLMAGAVVLTLPVLLVFIVAQHYFFSPEEQVTASRGALPSAVPPADRPRVGGGVERALRTGGSLPGLVLSVARDPLPAGRARRRLPVGSGAPSPAPRLRPPDAGSVRSLYKPGSRLLVWGRVGLALVALLTLTITVPAQPDRAGFQAAHFFFMPRVTWEMGAGRGMLHPEAGSAGGCAAAAAAPVAAPLAEAPPGSPGRALPPLDARSGPDLELGADAGDAVPYMPDAIPLVIHAAVFALPPGWTALIVPPASRYCSPATPPPVPPPRLAP